ncbi:dsDNA nuclease domain-containing protein [Pseudomonas sp. C9]|uniref:dsDNA nuclease domain-containing protein n=1 Tax=Pseudomonas sp. C9 TaxID=1311337 RepID=UPI0009850B50|nr:dsDNA nuclease domain-containing protein [Pseudomonas sp. C9]
MQTCDTKIIEITTLRKLTTSKALEQRSTHGGIDKLTITEIKPREVVGRETTRRFYAQFKAAALESLQLLDHSNIDRIYCDFHDDYVVRYITPSGSSYRFVQVKTNGKANERWSPLEIFGIKKRLRKDTTHDLKTSFAGRLFLHIENFGPTCNCVQLSTNINFDDDVLDIENDLRNGSFKGKLTKTLITEIKNNFPKLAHQSDSSILKAFSSFKLSPRENILDDEREAFITQASTKIYKYSEIHLTPPEVSKIVDTLVDLVRNKSSSVILEGMTELELEKVSAIALEDILGLLSISKTAFEILRAGGDNNAIKSASILQRTLTKSNFSIDTVNQFAQYKSDWDTWFRVSRHNIPNLQLTVYLQQANEVARKLANANLSILDLYSEVNKLLTFAVSTPGMQTIGEGQILGGVLAELVRGEGI